VLTGEGPPLTPTKCAEQGEETVEMRNGFPLKWLVDCGVYNGEAFGVYFLV
jgi:hypothetical protein